MKRNTEVYIKDILESIEKINNYTHGLSLEDFEKSDNIQDAVLRRLEIIGEAVKNLPSEFKKEHGDIPWKSIAGTRDVLIHEYFGVSFERVWSTIKKDLPELQQKLIQACKNSYSF